MIKFSNWLLVILLFGLIWPLPAQQAFVQCGEGENINPSECTFSDLLAVPVRIFNFLLGTAAIILLAVIILAGVRIILYHASEMPEAELTNAKMMLQRGIVGFIIIAFSYVIVSLLAYTLLGLSPSSSAGKILKSFGL